MSLQLFTKWYAKYLILIVCCLVLLIIPLIRGSWIGTDIFLFSRLAENPSFYDTLSFGGRDAIYEYGNSLVLSIAPDLLVQIIPFILGILSLLIFRQIIKNLSYDERMTNISSLLLILSPAFIYTFSFINQYLIATFLALCCFYFLTSKRNNWFCIIILAITPLFNFFIGLLTIILVILYLLINKKKKLLLWIAILLIAYLTIITYLLANYPVNWSNIIPENISTIFYDLGNEIGIGIFLAIIAAIGIITNWEKKYQNLFLFFSTSILFFLSFFLNEAIILFNIIIVLLGATGLIILMDSKWSDRRYRRYIVCIMLSGLVFSSVSQIDHLTEIQPTQEMLEGLLFLKGVSPGTVFTDPSRGIWMNYAEKENIADQNYLFAPDSQERLEDIEKVYYSRNADEIIKIFNKYSVDYIWIDSEMKKEIWDSDSQGILFILYYTKTFDNIYDENGVEIWEIK